MKQKRLIAAAAVSPAAAGVGIFPAKKMPLPGLPAIVNKFLFTLKGDQRGVHQGWSSHHAPTALPDSCNTVQPAIRKFNSLVWKAVLMPLLKP